MDSCLLCSLRWPVLYHPQRYSAQAGCLETITEPIDLPINQSGDRPCKESIVPCIEDRWMVRLLSQDQICPFHQMKINRTVCISAKQLNDCNVFLPLTPWELNNVISYNVRYHKLTLKSSVKHTIDLTDDHLDDEPHHAELDYELELLHQCNSRSIFLYEEMYPLYINQSTNRSIDQSSNQSSVHTTPEPSPQSADQLKPINQSIDDPPSRSPSALQPFNYSFSPSTVNEFVICHTVQALNRRALHR